MLKKHKATIISLFKPFRRHFIVLAMMLFTLAIFDAAIPYATKIAIDRFIVPKQTAGLKTFLILYGALVVAFASNVVLFIVMAGKLESKLAYSMRKEAFDRMQEFKFDYFDKEGVGRVLSRITSDIGKLSDIISWGIVDLVWAFTFMGAILTVMFFVNWQLALLVVTVIPFLVALSYFFQKKIFHTQKKIRKINSEVIRLINEGITGALTSKTLVTEEKNAAEFRVKTEEMERHSVKSAVLSSIYQPLTVNIGSIGIAMVIVAGGLFMEKTWITLGTLILFINYATMFFEPIRQIARIISEIQAAKAAAERVFSHLEQEPDMQVENPVPAFPIKGSLELRNVDFSYDERETVLENLSLSVKAGERIALVGETGAGKSTIVNLICKFYKPTKGDIIIDGVNYNQIEKEMIQSNLGYVLQTPQLFSGSILENIRYGRLDATEEEVQAAAMLAQAHDFISKLDEGYHTSVGEGGAKLSSGEKQLISIARAILANPKIFVLDEATSSIDVETESRIQKAIENVLAHRTSFIIAHRLSTVKFVDRIILLEHGKIKEMGSHEELMGMKGDYYNLYMNQFA